MICSRDKRYKTKPKSFADGRAKSPHKKIDRNLIIYIRFTKFRPPTNIDMEQQNQLEQSTK